MNEKQLLEHFAMVRDYWVNLPKEQIVLENGKTETEYRMNGLIFSILCLFDGVSDSPLNFTPIRLVSGNFPKVQGGTIINKGDTELHDLWCKLGN